MSGTDSLPSTGYTYGNTLLVPGRTIPTGLIALLEKTFQLGEVIVVKIMKSHNILGDFTLIMPKGESLKNET